MADINGNNFIIDIPRLISINNPGFYYDLVPGKYPGSWIPNSIQFWATTLEDHESESMTYGELGHKDLTNSIVTLMPAMEDPAWMTDGTGANRRRRLSEFEVMDGNWFEWPYFHDSDWIFTSKSLTAALKSKFKIQQSCGIVFDFCCYGNFLEKGTLIELWFGSEIAAKQYKLTVKRDGRGFLTKGLADSEQDALAKGWLVPNRWKTLHREWTRIYILPYGRNRILVSSSSGGLFVYEDKSIPRDLQGKTLDTFHPTITEFATYKFRFNSRGTVRTNGIPYTGIADHSDSIAKVKGYIDLRPNRQITIPRLFGSEVIRTVNTYDRPSALLTADNPVMVTNAITTTTGDSAKLAPRITLRRRDISDEDVYQTPIFYRSELYVDPIRQIKPDESVEVYAAIENPTFSIQDGRLSGSVTLKDVKNYPFYRRRFNIPFRFTDLGNHVFEGVLTSPKPKQSGFIINQEWALSDYMLWLEKTPVYDLERLDGYSVSDAVKAILKTCGFPADGSLWNITETPTTGITHEPIQKLSKGEADSNAVNLSDVLKTPKEWLDYLVDTYTSSNRYPFKWVYGFMPFYDSGVHALRYKFYFLDPDTFSDTPDLTIYPTEAIAVTHGITKTNAPLYVFQEVEEEEVVEPEGNAVLGVGMDGEGNTITKYVENRDSIDTAVLPANRETSWLGDRRVVILEDPALNTQELVNAATMFMYYRVKAAFLNWKIRMRWNPGLLPWMLLRIYTYRDDGLTLEYRDWRVTGMTVQADKGGLYPMRQTTATVSLTTPYVNKNGTAA